MGVGDFPNYKAEERGKAGYNARFHTKILPEGVEIFDENRWLDLAY